MCVATRLSDPELISSRRNPLVRQLRQLHDSAGRREQGLMLVEGTHLLHEALRLGLVPTLLVATPSWFDRHRPLLAVLPASCTVRAATAEVLAAMATTRSPDGVVHTLPLPWAGAESLHSAAPPGFVLALDRLQDPGNLGTLMRTALAAGVDQIWLGEGADPWQPKVLRASSGAALALSIVRLAADGLRDRVDQAGTEGLQRLAAVLPSPDCSAPRPYWQIDWTRPTLLLLGNEGAGLAPDLLALADQRITIPHSSEVESLNVAVAAAPLLLERWRQSLLAPEP
jgi:TrmH family RNA methyltransferase